MAKLKRENPDDATIHHEKRKREMAPARMQVNLTSMIDIVFQLLIYFIVTASFVMDEGLLNANLPQTGGESSVIDLQQIEIKVFSEGQNNTTPRIEVLGVLPGGRPYVTTDFEALLTELKALKASDIYSKSPILLKIDDRTRWEHTTNAFNAAKAAQFERINFDVKRN